MIKTGFVILHKTPSIVPLASRCYLARVTLATETTHDISWN